ncbi:MAG: aldehyde dehydrogenase, partial [Pseudomonadota bacterium]
MTDRAALFADFMAAVGLGRRPESLIGGELVAGGGEPIAIVDPFTGRELCDYPDCGAALAARAAEAASKAQAVWARDFTAHARG